MKQVLFEDRMNPIAKLLVSVAITALLIGLGLSLNWQTEDTASAPATERAAATTPAPDPEQTPAAIPPGGPRRLSGRAVHEDGGGVAGATAELFEWSDAGSLLPPARRFVARTSSDTAGHFSIEVLATARRDYELKIRHREIGEARISGLRFPSDRELGELALLPGVELRGRVVVREGGRPLPGAEVRVITDEGRCSELVRSAADGSFLLPHRRERELRVEARLDGWAVASVRVRLPTAAPVELAMARPHPLRGTVRNDLGEPVAGASLEVLRCNGGRCRDTALSDDEGRFGFDLEAGYYRLSATHPRHRPANLARVHTNVLALPVVLSRQATAEVSLPSIPAGEVPVVVQLLGPSQDSAARGLPRTAVARDRVLTLRGLPAGRARLRICVPGRAPVITPAIELLAGARTSAGELHPPQGARLRGTVLDEHGAPLAAIVSLVRREDVPESARLSSSPHRRVAAADATGAFLFDDLSGGDHELEIVVRAYVPRRLASGSVPAGGELTLDPVRLALASTLRGVVRDRSNGRPLPDAELELRAGDGWRAVSDALGRYEFTALPAGRHLLIVRPPYDDESPFQGLGPGRAARAQVDVSSGDTVEFDVLLDL